MPCREGCSPATGRRLCRCGRRCSGKRRQSSDRFCTTNTCTNPEFCMTYKPHFCPNASPSQENFAGQPPQPQAQAQWPPQPQAQWPPQPQPQAQWPPQPQPQAQWPPQPQAQAQWPPQQPAFNTSWPPSPQPHSPHFFHSPDPSRAQHPHSHHSIPSQHSYFSPQGQTSQHNSTQTTGNEGKSSPRCIGKPSLTPMNCSQNAIDPNQSGSGSRPNFMTSPKIRSPKPTAIGRPSLSYIGGGSHMGMSPAASNVCYESPAAGSPHGTPGYPGQPIHYQQAPQAYGNAFGSNLQQMERDRRCECRMPPAFGRFRCTGNLSGLCDCDKRDEDK